MTHCPSDLGPFFLMGSLHLLKARRDRAEAGGEDDVKRQTRLLKEYTLDRIRGSYYDLRDMPFN